MAAPLHRHVSRERLCTLVPSGLRFLASAVDLPEPYAVVVFSSHPVRLGEVKRALKKVGPLQGEQLILAGIDFTKEALALATAHGARVLARTHFGWTEASYDGMHISSATDTKRPSR